MWIIFRNWCKTITRELPPLMVYSFLLMQCQSSHLSPATLNKFNGSIYSIRVENPIKIVFYLPIIYLLIKERFWSQQDLSTVVSFSAMATIFVPVCSISSTTRSARRQRSSPQRVHRIRKQYKRLNAELKHCCKWQSMTWLWCHKIVKRRDVVYAMPLKHIPFGWCGQNMKAIPYMLNPLGWCLHTTAIMYTFQNLNTVVKDKVWPDPDLGRRSNWGRGVCYWKVLP